MENCKSLGAKVDSVSVAVGNYEEVKTFVGNVEKNLW